jgi:diguanylate cyclase (GGDEF)-like protein
MLETNESSFLINLKKVSLLKASIIVSSITVGLFFTDYITGTEISFSIFYLIPVTIAVFLSGKGLGLVFSVVCAVAWITADILAGTHFTKFFIPVWNTLVRLGYFTINTMIIGKLLESIEQIKKVSFYDPLTNVANWRYFEEYSNMVIKSSVRLNTEIALAYFDIDNFKSINDTLGHSIGDEVLVVIAKVVKNEIRSSDLLARLGGDEFAILLLNTNFEKAEEILHNLQNKIRIEMTRRKLDVTLSIGAIVFSVLPSTIGPMLKKVDEIMYEVKNNGKNNLKVVKQYE